MASKLRAINYFNDNIGLTKLFIFPFLPVSAGHKTRHTAHFSQGALPGTTIAWNRRWNDQKVRHSAHPNPPKQWTKN